MAAILKAGTTGRLVVTWPEAREGPTRWLSADNAIAAVGELNGDNFADVDGVAPGRAALFASALGPGGVDQTAVIEIWVIPGDELAGAITPDVGASGFVIYGGMPTGGTPLYPGGVTP